MTEWWTYRLSDFLLFSPRTWFRLFELYHQALWPWQIVVALGWLLLCVAAWRRAAWAPRAWLLALALAWAWVAWAFHAQRYAAINWAADVFALAFAVQAVLLAVAAWKPVRIEAAPAAGPLLLAGALLLMPLLPPVFGHAWMETESFGLTPDATVLGTLGVLLMFAPAYPAVAVVQWVVPLMWGLVSGATLWTMELPWAPVLPAACIWVALLAWRRGLKCAH
ncbi:MAG: DUF6064 family protein [Piscinibacter sp.]